MIRDMMNVQGSWMIRDVMNVQGSWMIRDMMNMRARDCRWDSAGAVRQWSGEQQRDGQSLLV
jgi:hypothetical protein